MKSFEKLLGLLFVAMLVLFASCEGPSGSAGPAGVNANDHCKDCHNIANNQLKTSQYNLSAHAIGANVKYAGGRNKCAKCHSHQGFIETNITERDTTAANFLIATPVGCATCHDSHISFDTLTDGKDYALRASDPFKFIIDKDGGIVDFGRSSNGCANCHQPLYAAPVANAEGNYQIVNNRFGPHHGPQSTFLYGTGAYEFPGSLAYPKSGSSTHAKSGACVTCHMGKAEVETGGHTFVANVASCIACHKNATNFDLYGLQTEVEKLLAELAVTLKAKGIMDDLGSAIPGTYPIELAGAYFNYKGVVEDRSKGVHNPAYILVVLKNSIEAVK